MKNIKKSILFSIFSISLFFAGVARLESMYFDLLKRQKPVSKDELIQYLRKCFVKKKDKFNFNKLKYLVEKGADVNAVDRYLNTPLHIVCRRNSDIEIIKYLVEKKAKINGRNLDLRTPLSLICEYNPEVEIVRYLVKKGADVNLPDQYSNTPLHMICRRSADIEIIKCLIEGGANINDLNGEFRTPLYEICRHDADIKTIKYLLEKGADINARNKNGNTPLHIIPIENKSFDSILFLIINGADSEIENNKYETLIDRLVIMGGYRKKIEELSGLLNLSEDLRSFLKYLNSNKSISKNLFDSDIFGVKCNRIWVKTRTSMEPEKLKKSLKDYYIEKKSIAGVFKNNSFDTKALDEEKRKIVDQKLMSILETTKKKIKLSSKDINELSKITSVFLEWVYFGEVTDPDKELIVYVDNLEIIKTTREDLIKDICNWTDPKIDFEGKSKRFGLLKDLRVLKNNEETKDFKILIKNKKEKNKELENPRIEIEENNKNDNEKEDYKSEEVGVHKFILMARSGLFKSFFEEMGKIDTIKDYSKRTVKQIQKLVNYLYSDYVDFENDVDLAESLEDAVEYYQLNKNSLLKFLTKEFLDKVKEKKEKN